MCPASCPSTIASSASDPKWARIPRVTNTGPPGSAKALTTGSSATWKLHGRSGRSVSRAISSPMVET